jgi:hypothetical protein
MTPERERKILLEMDAAWQTLNEFIPIRREGEPIPDGVENGRFSIQWWRGPRLFYRQHDHIWVVGYHAYTTEEGQPSGPYIQEYRRK